MKSEWAVNFTNHPSPSLKSEPLEIICHDRISCAPKKNTILIKIKFVKEKKMHFNKELVSLNTDLWL